MATSVIPKSEMRRNENIAIGYGEVPAVYEMGRVAWGLPGGRLTYCPEEAKKYAKRLDGQIRKTLKSRQQLISI